VSDAGDIVVHKVDAFPIRWGVQCPCCDAWVETDDMHEGIDGGTFDHHDYFGDPFLSCECGAVLEPRRMRLTRA
jgi:hypothetical protein